MKGRIPRYCAALVLSVLPLPGIAVSIGDVQVHSYLNQPLYAEIPLDGLPAEGSDGIAIRLGNSQDFSRLDIEYQHYLTDLRFAVIERTQGWAIEIRSTGTVREPYVVFPLTVRWSGGQLVRAYTLLLDPPPQHAPARVRTPAKTTPGAPIPGHDYGPVQPGETLWPIAQRLRQAGTSTRAMMDALVRANPDAFVNQDPNRLRAGAILVVPSAPDSSAIVAPSPPAPAEPTEVRPQMRIVTPQQQAQERARTEQQILLHMEQSESYRQDAVDIRARVEQLELQVGDMRHLLELKDVQIATLQQTVRDLNARARRERQPTDTRQPAQTRTAPRATATSPTPQVSEKPRNKTSANPAAIAASAPARTPALVNDYLWPALYGIAGLSLLALGVFGLRWSARRNRRDEFADLPLAERPDVIIGKPTFAQPPTAIAPHALAKPAKPAAQPIAPPPPARAEPSEIAAAVAPTPSAPPPERAIDDTSIPDWPEHEDAILDIDLTLLPDPPREDLDTTTAPPPPSRSPPVQGNATTILFPPPAAGNIDDSEHDEYLHDIDVGEVAALLLELDLDDDANDLDTARPSNDWADHRLQPDQAHHDDNVSISMDLARAYREIGDRKGAREILTQLIDEVDDLGRRHEIEAMLADVDRA